MAKITKYGRPIDKEEGHSYLNELVLMKDGVAGSLKNLFAEGSANRRFYCGRHEQPVSMEPGIRDCDDVAFIFDKESLTEIVSLLNKGEASGVIIFNAVRNKKSDPNIAAKDIGRPTVMIYPYKNSVKDGIVNDEELEIFLDEGREHPGTGGKVDEVEDEKGKKYQIPARYKVTDIYRK